MTRWSGVVALGLGGIGLIMSLVFNIFSVALIYFVPLVIVGLIIIFRKNEDNIEQINYREVKKNGKK